MPQEGPGLASADAQAAYARLAVAKVQGPRALRFLAAYTDGGTDGGDAELHYWADHALLPQVGLRPHPTGRETIAGGVAMASAAA